LKGGIFSPKYQSNPLKHIHSRYSQLLEEI
jgi:hypothetical protein